MNAQAPGFNPPALDRSADLQTQPPGIVIAGAALTVAGLAGFWNLLTGPFGLWQTLAGDALRSIGLLIPPVSLWLACRAWSWADWSRGGTWWGFALMAAALLLAAVKSLVNSMGMFHAGGGVVTFSFLPVGVLLCAYLSGAVLLFGGVGAWRKARFPLLLWLFINPVPHSFENLIDLPLQTAAAQVTRAFAQWLGVPVQGATLKMMFSPELGIFIAPGCNGLRGATTMAYMALIIGYLRQLPARPWMLFVAYAVALAYLLNFVRLCGVIVYYWFALRIPSIGQFGTEIDYAIGGTVFCLAAAFLLRGSQRHTAQ